MPWRGSASGSTPPVPPDVSARSTIAGLRRTAALLRPYAGGEGPYLAGGALLGTALVAFHVLRPWPLKWALDFLGNQQVGGVVGVWVNAAPGRGLVALGLLFVVLALAGAAAEYGQTMLLAGAANRVMFRFRAALFAHVLRQPLAFHESSDVGELLTRVLYDTSRLRRGLVGVLLRIVQTLALFLATLAVLVWLAPALGLVFAAGGVLAFMTMRRRGRRIARAARRQRQKEGKLAALVAEDLGSVRELQAFGAPDGGAGRAFERRNNQSLGREQKVRRLAAGLALWVEALLAITTAGALALGVQGVLSGRLTAGDLVLFFHYAVALRGPLAEFAAHTVRLGRTQACAERLAAIADRPAPAEEDGGIVVPTLAGSVAFAGVSAKAPLRTRLGRKWALNGVTFDIPAGRRVAVIGGNGAGKSTLIRLVLRLANPASGVVSLDGRDLRDYAIDSIRRHTSVVFQNGVLPGFTVRENIALGILDAVPDRVVRAAAVAARADAIIDRLPEGYDTMIRRGGSLLSGGERQRIALARALLRDGQLWLLDEPTAGLDPDSASEITEMLLDRTRGRTTLWVTHDPALVPRLDWVIVLDGGTLTYAGPTDAYLASLSRRLPTAGELVSTER